LEVFVDWTENLRRGENGNHESIVDILLREKASSGTSQSLPKCREENRRGKELERLELLLCCDEDEKK
jgi:hypothetical protein